MKLTEVEWEGNYYKTEFWSFGGNINATRHNSITIYEKCSRNYNVHVKNEQENEDFIDAHK